MHKPILVLFLAGLLSACGVQPAVDLAAVQNAIQQTVVADWTATFTPGPTGTFTPTWTATALPTETLTPLPTDTPTPPPSATPDLRLIDADPYDFLLTAADLPAEARFFLTSTSSESLFVTLIDWDSYPLLYTFHINPINDREAHGWGAWHGQTILEANGLVDGWRVSYVSGRDLSLNLDKSEIDYVFDHVVLFRSIEGAQIMVKEYGLCTNPGIGYTILETDFQIGDLTRVCSPITNTDMSRIYAIEFSYKNIYHNVWVSGMESDLGPEALASVARALLVKLEAAPLSNIVTFHP